MPKLSIKRVLPALLAGLLLTTPLSAWADVNPDVSSAASAGIQYLANNQGSDGSISGFGGESEWSVEAIEADGQDASTFAHNGSPSLVDFVATDVPAAGAPVTSLERNIIAIAAAGQDPSNFGGINYDAELLAQDNGGQIGDPTLLNDDIFGLIAIAAAHYSQLQNEAQDALNYLLANQDPDGGFSYTTTPGTGSDNNDTAAAIIALYAAQELGLTASNLGTAQSNALTYLLGTQQPDGGFAYDNFSPSDGDSTAWSLMALNAVGSSVSAQATLARNWLLQTQNIDGGFTYGAFGVTNSDTFTTANAVIALLGTTWLLKPAPTTTTSPPAPVASSPSPAVTTPASPPPAQPATIVTTSSSVQGFTDGPAANPPATDTAAVTPQVKAASTTQPSTPAPKAVAITAKKTDNRTAYGAGLLVLVALIWFMLESRRSKGSKSAK